jgi:hypothetical protein
MPTAKPAADVLEIPKKRGAYGEGTVFQRSDNGRWQIGFYDLNGRRRQQSFNTEAQARKALHRHLVLRDAGKLDPPESRTKIETLANAYLRYIKNSTKS